MFKWFDANLDSPWARLTYENGLAGIASDRLVDRLNLPPKWWLLTVENWESFYQLVYHETKVAIIVVYLEGNVSEVVLRALSQLRPEPEHILHFGDYDWIGLSIFQRLQSVFPKAVLYIPEDIERLFKEHGNRKLIENQSLPINFDLHNNQYQLIIELISQYNVGLEQEIAGQPSIKDFDS